MALTLDCKFKFWNGYIFGLGGPIDMELKAYEWIIHDYSRDLWVECVRVMITKMSPSTHLVSLEPESNLTDEWMKQNPNALFRCGISDILKCCHVIILVTSTQADIFYRQEIL